MRKERAAAAARLEPFQCVLDHSARFHLEVVSTPFSDALLDGPFFQSDDEREYPSINLVFVQSRNGNTEASDPSTLGGGETDKHVIYEGLSRLGADAVMSGARTIGRGNLIFSVWHPALVSLRQARGKPRHPIQIVATTSGAIPIEAGLLFNVPDIRVVIMTGPRGAEALRDRLRSRPWISVLNTGTGSDLRAGVRRLHDEFGISRVSAVGGRTLATALIDQSLVKDLYLTTGAIDGGTRDTPFYEGSDFPERDLVVRKRSREGILFEHFILHDRGSSSA
jgi:riboflavin biosynthesis pyrimidine reductase